jgi:hypothetical protein
MVSATRGSVREAEMLDGGRRDAGLLEQRRDRRRHDLEITLVADPALFPDIIELAAMAAVMVDEIRRYRMLREKLGDAIGRAEQHGRAAVAARKLERACGGGAPLLGGNDQRGLAVERDRARRGDERRSPGPQRARDVERGGLAADVERLGDDAGVLPVIERRRRRGEIQRRDFGAAVLAEAIPRRLDRHGHRILIPVADRALGFRLRLERRIGPGMRVDDGLAAQSEPRNVAAEFLDADQFSTLQLRYSA